MATASSRYQFLREIFTVEIRELDVSTLRGLFFQLPFQFEMIGLWPEQSNQKEVPRTTLAEDPAPIDGVRTSSSNNRSAVPLKLLLHHHWGASFFHPVQCDQCNPSGLDSI